MAPFSGNIVELCPVGALTSQPYRFRARPWDIEGAGGICTLCPSQCNVTFTVRDDRVVRVLARDYEGNKGVDDGWLCDKGRFAYQAIHVDERITKPLVRDAGELREVSWERALETAAGLAKHQGRVGALVGGQATNEEGFLLAAADARGAALGRHRLAREPAAPTRRSRARWPRRRCRRRVPDIEFAHTVLLVGCEPLDDAPILDLRIRKGVRRNGVKLAIAQRPPERAGPQRQADRPLRARRRAGAARGAGARRSAAAAATTPRSARWRTLLRDGGEDVVILWGERIGCRRGRGAAADRRAASGSPAATVPGCSRSRPAPTAAGCARPA